MEPRIKCAAPCCRRTAQHGKRHCQQHLMTLSAVPVSRRTLVMGWLVDLALAKDLREAERLLAACERRMGKRVQQPRLDPVPDYDPEIVAIVAHYAVQRGRCEG